MNFYLHIFISSAAVLTYASGQIRQPGPAQERLTETPRVYSTWTVFFHPRLGLELPVPPGVSAVGNPETAIEPKFISADQHFVMSVGGGISSELPSRIIATQWDAAQQKADRKITYQRRGKTWFVVSGSDVRGFEFYEKFTMRGQQVAFLNITYPRSRIRQYDPWVEQIENGFRLVAWRGAALEFPPKLTRSQGGPLMERTPLEAKTPPEMAESTPAPIPESKPTQGMSQTRPEVEVAPSTNKVPLAVRVVGKPGFVYSPFSNDQRIVDVVDVPSGTKMKCPYTMKIFRVP